MFVTMNRIPVNPEYTRQFEENFQRRARLVDRMPGFIRNLVLRPANPAEQPYVVMTFWESQAHFEGWVESPEFKEGHARSGTLPREVFRGHSQLETYEVFTDSAEAPAQEVGR
ncbi:Antibiotic biosynthesis monooxygenase [Allomeiothermus silvanus DSM 9946]|uniref:Antibiotic biosynthesis monooxygenase n=1 Tax=Allomeiothermus silvanus (strain ATCC 700542 / DSM 9946 / NBRC 106475 / NCIMB 13440 / VI-R2) TaxID=526227 RepID=D7BHV0_ALLS1|nr:antibiotic biosynthesis monooxygenase [Allomeiothermus silvanus]ADH64040.1 Antibiotic biosynthesis monooxygenase [Allomeiothermus silvanus DSM 9946]